MTTALGPDFNMTPSLCPMTSLSSKARREKSKKVDVELDRECDAILDGRYGAPEVSYGLKTPPLKFHFLSTYWKESVLDFVFSLPCMHTQRSPSEKSWSKRFQQTTESTGPRPL